MNYYDGVILKPSLDELYLEHHGVKGQKWGVEHGPPYPLGSGASTGNAIKKNAKPKKVYKSRLAKKSAVKQIRSEATDERKEATHETDPKNKKMANDYADRLDKVADRLDNTKTKDLSDKDLKVIDSANKIQGSRRPSPKETKTIESAITKPVKPESKTIKLYKDLGMSQQDAEAAALRKKRIALAMGITAGVAVASIAGYAAYKHYTNPLTHDLTLKKGLEMQTLSTFTDRTTNGEPFFAAITKKDKAQYIKSFSDDVITGERKSVITNTLSKSAKIASVDSSQKIFNDLYSNNKEFKDAIDFRISGGHSKSGDEFLKELSNQDKYLAFNRDFVLRDLDDKGNRVIPKEQRIFISALSDKGYHGLMDTNDVKGTKSSKSIGNGLFGTIRVQQHGINTEKPIIFFDTSSITNKSINKLSDADINKAAKTFAKIDSAPKFEDIRDAFKDNPMLLAQVFTGAATIPLIFSTTYDQAVTGKSSDEIAEVKYKKKSKS